MNTEFETLDMKSSYAEIIDVLETRTDPSFSLVDGTLGHLILCIHRQLNIYRQSCFLGRCEAKEPRLPTKVP